MASYISSNANRFYTSLESSYGEVGAITAANRIPAVQLRISQQMEPAERRDKTGSRTFAGMPPGMRRRTNFELQTYLTSWAGSGDPSYGPLFQGALGGSPLRFAGGTAAASAGEGRLTFQADHELTAGQAIACGGEIRFVAALVDARTVQLSAPLTSPPAPGTPISATVTYVPATYLPSVSVFDYWSPETALQRLLCGAAVDELEILVNGDFHEFRFRGIAQDVIDSSTFSGELGELQSFPSEPDLAGFDYSIVPGHMGQAWLGSSVAQFYTISSASILLKNDVETRSREFGTNLPRAIFPGRRSVTASFSLFSQDDANTQGLYQAARHQSPIAVMFQLGEVEGQLMGVYLKSVIPELPEFDDSENRLQWRFRPSRAQGTIDDEIVVAFG